MGDVATRRRSQGPGLSGQDWWGAFELLWPRVPHRVLTEPEGVWREQWVAIPKQRRPFLDPPPAGPWVRVNQEAPIGSSHIFGNIPRYGGPSAAETVIVYRLDWPPGGL